MQDFPYPRDEKLNWRIQWAKKLFKALLQQSENRKIEELFNQRNLIGRFFKETIQASLYLDEKGVS